MLKPVRNTKETKNRPVKEKKADTLVKAANNGILIEKNTTRNLLPRICEICNRKFPENHKMKRHMLIHTKEKPYK